MVGPMTEKSIWIFITLFPVFVSITQFSDFWVMSYGNWKHILGVFSFHNSVFYSIFVIKHTQRDPLLEQQPQLLTLFFFFLLARFSEFSFLYSSVHSFFHIFFFLPFRLSFSSEFVLSFFLSFSFLFTFLISVCSFFFPFSSQTHKKDQETWLNVDLALSLINPALLLINGIALALRQLGLESINDFVNHLAIRRLVPSDPKTHPIWQFEAYR